MIVPVGYYTLAELGTLLEGQGVPIRVSARCERDVYAIRAADVRWNDLRAALVADGRLTISSDGQTWSIALNVANRDAERSELARYVEAVRGGLHAVYEPARRRALELWDLDEPKRSAELQADLESLGADAAHRRPTDVARLGLVSQALTDHRFGDYGAMSFPAFLTAPGRALDRAWISSFMDAAPLIVPGGDFRKHPIIMSMVAAEGEEAAIVRFRSFFQGGKLVWDPLTLTTGYRSPIWIPDFAKFLDQIDSGDAVTALTPRSFRLDPPKTPSLRPVDEAFSNEVIVPDRPMVASEAMLRWAESDGKNLVAYVSSFGDLPLKASASRSFASIVRATDSDGLDAAWIETAILEWTGLSGTYRENRSQRRPTIVADHRLTVSKVGDFAVVRTEARPLDGLVPPNLALPTSWANLRLKDERPTLLALVRLVSRLRPREWKGGLFPLGELEWTNPISFYPFSAMLANDPQLLAEVGALGEGKTLTRPLSALKSAARLREAIVAAASFNDAVTDQRLDPIVVPFALKTASNALEIDVVRQDGRLTFALVAPKRAQDGMRKTLWSSWVRL